MKQILFAAALAVLALPSQAATMQVDIQGAFSPNQGALGVPQPNASGDIAMSWTFTYDTADAVMEWMGSTFVPVIRAGSYNGKPGFQNSTLTVGSQTFTNFGDFGSFAGIGSLGSGFPGVNIANYGASLFSTDAGHRLEASFSLIVFDDTQGGSGFLTGLDQPYAMVGAGSGAVFSALPQLYGLFNVFDVVVNSDGSETAVRDYDLTFARGSVTVTDVSPAAVPLPASGLLLAGGLLFLLRRRR